jgi:hypothetical protein
MAKYNNPIKSIYEDFPDLYVYINSKGVIYDAYEDSNGECGDILTKKCAFKYGGKQCNAARNCDAAFRLDDKSIIWVKRKVQG